MKPHKSLYWLNKEKDEQFDEKVSDISHLYQQAASLAAVGERVISVDEKTGIQALERKHPTKPMIAGKVGACQKFCVNAAVVVDHKPRSLC